MTKGRSHHLGQVGEAHVSAHCTEEYNFYQRWYHLQRALPGVKATEENIRNLQPNKYNHFPVS